MEKSDSTVVRDLKNAMAMLLKGKFPETIQTDGCSEDIGELVKLFNMIADNVKELFYFSTALASGDFDAENPKKSNFMAAGLKELRSRLYHLTWQAQQVAKGDYQQKVDFMGDFSIAFNNMAEKLLERENKLKAEIDERKKVEKELEYYAFTDSMTGVSNRRTGLLMLEKEILRSKRSGKVLSLCYFDIDGLKTVNDVYGHNEGDYLIVTILGLIKVMIREIDTISRMGGDEFLIIFPGCNSALAQNVIDRIYEELHKINKSGKKPYKLDFSYGIGEIGGNEIVTLDEIIKNIDEKMYQNKMAKKEKRI